MRVATINIPKNLNNGMPCPEVLFDAVGALVKAFGGATVVDGFGYWNNGNVVQQEPMNVISCAMDVTQENKTRLWAVAQSAAIAADQQSIYVVHADGEVEFVEKPKAANAA